MGFHINDLKKLGDVQRTYTWKVFIPDISKVTNTKIDADNFILRARSVSLPSRGNDPIESYFYGMKQVFPGRPVFTNTMSITLEEFEDQKLLKALYEWQENIYSTDLKSGHPGNASLGSKTQYAVDVLLRMYKQFENEELDKYVRVKNAWISNIDEVNLDYTAQDSVKYNLTLAYDWWQLEDSGK